MPPPQGANPEIGQFWRVSARPFSCGVYTKCKKRGERDKRSYRDMFASLSATAEKLSKRKQKVPWQELNKLHSAARRHIRSAALGCARPYLLLPTFNADPYMI